jgi:hypothetical protein
MVVGDCKSDIVFLCNHIFSLKLSEKRFSNGKIPISEEPIASQHVVHVQKMLKESGPCARLHFFPNYNYVKICSDAFGLKHNRNNYHRPRLIIQIGCFKDKYSVAA